MRNKGKILLLALTLLCCAAFAVYQYRYLRTADREPPKISMAQQELTLSVSDPDTHLLEGMSAADARDGDVTPSLIVESVRGVVADKRFTVTYAAFDRAGNVAKAQRTVFYSDYTSPRFSLSAPLIFRAGVSPDAFAPLSAQDVFDGDLTERMLHPSMEVDKTYLARVSNQVTPEEARQLERGVMVDGRKTSRAKVHILSVQNLFTDMIITIHEGRNRQVRKMVEQIGHQVVMLRRIRFGPLKLGELPRGMWRPLTQEELDALKKL